MGWLVVWLQGRWGFWHCVKMRHCYLTVNQHIPYQTGCYMTHNPVQNERCTVKNEGKEQPVLLYLGRSRRHFWTGSCFSWVPLPHCRAVPEVPAVQWLPLQLGWLPAASQGAGRPGCHWLVGSATPLQQTTQLMRHTAMEGRQSDILWQTAMEGRQSNILWQTAMEGRQSNILWQTAMEVRQSNILWQTAMEGRQSNILWQTAMEVRHWYAMTDCHGRKTV